MLGLLDWLIMDVKAKMQRKKDFKEKFKKSQKKEKIVGAALKATDEEIKRLERRNDDLTESKKELHKRYAPLEGVRNFCAIKSAGIVSKTCLRSPKVYEWLLEFTGVMINIGYST